MGISASPPQKNYAKKPESELLAKLFADMIEKRGEHLAKHFADVRPSIPGKLAARNFTKNRQQIP